jgi:hypothetical protein
MTDYWQRAALYVEAIGGDPAALRAVRERLGSEAFARDLRLGSALALAASDAGEAPAPEWTASLQASMTSWLLVDEAVSSIGETLRDGRHRWAPIKGYDVGRRFYDERERREIGDLDILVDPAEFDPVREALEAAGWTGWTSGERAEQYMTREGYAWQAKRGSLELLEVHFRFWGVVPEGLEAEALAVASPDPILGGTAVRLSPEHCYLIAAVHAWTQQAPRSLNDWRDMSRIVRSGADGWQEAVAELTRRWSLELPVALSADVARRLWPDPSHDELLALLRPRLGRWERWVLDRLDEAGADAVAWSSVALARLLAGRPSRAGWRSVWRRLWPHPAKVEEATPSDWSWLRRRSHHLWSSWAG